MERNSDFNRQDRASSGNAFQLESPELALASEFLNPQQSKFEEESVDQENISEESVQMSVANENTTDSPNPIVNVGTQKEQEEELSLEPPSLELLFANHNPEPPDDNGSEEDPSSPNSGSDIIPVLQKMPPTQFQLEDGTQFTPSASQMPSYSIPQAVQETNAQSQNNSDPLIAKMEAAFGQDFSSVNITPDSSEATDLGARAFAQGNNIHFAPGEYNPNSTAGQELLGHELTHVVLQKQGRVQPTIQGKGFHINDDPSLGNEADEMGSRATISRDSGADL